MDFSKLLTIEEQRAFWNKVDKQPGGCWEWDGANNGAQKRAVYWHKGERYVAARVAWSLHHGTAVPDGMLVCHRCDNPNCLNVLEGHLFLGSQADNMRDCAAKGRHHWGERTPNSKLTDRAVLLAKYAYFNGLETMTALANKLGVSEPTLNLAVHGKTWKHVPHPEEVINGLQ